MKDDKLEIMPNNWLSKIKDFWPSFCWAELVMWNMRYRPILDIFRPEEEGMLVGGCYNEVEEYGHGWCGHCAKK